MTTTDAVQVAVLSMTPTSLGAQMVGMGAASPLAFVCYLGALALTFLGALALRPRLPSESIFGRRRAPGPSFSWGDLAIARDPAAY